MVELVGPHFNFDDANAAPGDPGSSLAEDCFSPATDSITLAEAPITSASAAPSPVTTADSASTEDSSEGGQAMRGLRITF